MIDLQEVGAHVSHDGARWLVRIGSYLPGIRTVIVCGRGAFIAVINNFSSSEQQGWAPFPHAGTWTELLDADSPGGADSVAVDEPGAWHAVSLPAHYGPIYRISH